MSRDSRSCAARHRPPRALSCRRHANRASAVTAARPSPDSAQHRLQPNRRRGRENVEVPKWGCWIMRWWPRERSRNSTLTLVVTAAATDAPGNVIDPLAGAAGSMNAAKRARAAFSSMPKRSHRLSGSRSIGSSQSSILIGTREIGTIGPCRPLGGSAFPTCVWLVEISLADNKNHVIGFVGVAPPSTQRYCRPAEISHASKCATCPSFSSSCPIHSAQSRSFDV